MRRISWRAEGSGLLASQYWFCTLEVVLQFVGKVDKNQLRLKLYSECGGPMQARSQTMNTVVAAASSAGAYGVIAIAIRHGLDGQGIESRWGRYFPQLSRTALGPTHPRVDWLLGLSPGGTAAEVWRLPPKHIWRQGWRKSRSITPLPLWAFMLCYWVNFTFCTFAYNALLYVCMCVCVYIYIYIYHARISVKRALVNRTTKSTV